MCTGADETRLHRDPGRPRSTAPGASGAELVSATNQERQVTGANVTAGFLETFGAHPLLGRFFEKRAASLSWCLSQRIRRTSTKSTWAS